jgi:DNA-binding FadR family transcriptional regulator
VVTAAEQAQGVPPVLPGAGLPGAGLPGAGLPGASPSSKRAEKVTDLIVADVLALGWPVGALLGSEAELIARYKVSRAVFREAVRLVEHQQVARTRRGPGGGLIITEPTVDAVIDAVVFYLYRAEARLDEVFEARLVLEEIVTDLAPVRLDEDAVRGLRGFAVQDDADLDSDPRALHALLASISRNPALELFVDVLMRVTMLYSADWLSLGRSVRVQTAHAHGRIAAAVLDGDASLARHRMRRHLEAEFDFLRQGRSTRQLLPDHVVVLGESGNGKLAEAVARRITQTIVRNGMRPGEFAGAERDLIEREGVSRAVLREAVRLLEHHQIARMRRGPGGGLFVFEPSVSAVTEIAAIYLARRGMRRSDLAELRAAGETALAGLAAERADRAGVEQLRAVVERERAAEAAGRAGAGRRAEGGLVEAGPDLHAVIAGMARSRVLELVILVLIRLSRLQPADEFGPEARHQLRTEALRAHAGLADAIESGDAELARRLMRRHLDILCETPRADA